jgi:glycosyltransferase involved in cell wall biosynthesis
MTSKSIDCANEPSSAAEPRPRLSVVLPAHNEEAALGATIEQLAEALAGQSHEIIIVDDGSTDETWQAIRRIKATQPGVRALRFTRNFGHQSAILAGLVAARGEAVITMDSDGQHPAAVVSMLIEHWQRGHQVVQTIRTGEDRERPLKRWASRVFYRALSLVSGVTVPPGAADFRLLARPVVQMILQSTGPLLFLRGLIPWLGYETSYVPFQVAPRTAGRPSYTWRRMLRLSIDGLISFSIIPLRISIALGVSLSVLSFLYLIYIVIIFLVSKRVVPGWASVAGLVSLVGGIQLLMIGVLGEYVGRLFVSNLHRPHFVIREQL